MLCTFASEKPWARGDHINSKQQAVQFTYQVRSGRLGAASLHLVESTTSWGREKGEPTSRGHSSKKVASTRPAQQGQCQCNKVYKSDSQGDLLIRSLNLGVTRSNEFESQREYQMSRYREGETQGQGGHLQGAGGCCSGIMCGSKGGPTCEPGFAKEHVTAALSPSLSLTSMPSLMRGGGGGG